MAGLPGIVISIGADTKDAVDGINRVRGSLGDSMDGFDKFKSGVDKAFVPAVAAFTALGVAAVDFAKAAAEDQKSADLLANSLKNTTNATDAQVASTEEWIASQGKLLGVADDQLRPSLSKLASATGSIAEAQKAASLAMDIAAQTGVPLETVSAKLAAAYGGQTAGLKKLVPGLDAAVLASGDMVAIQAMLADKVGGAAATAANTASGQMQRFALAIDEAKEGIGAALLPALDAVLPYLQSLGQWAQENTTTLLIIGGVIGGIAATIITLKIAIEAWTIAQTVLNAVLAANPIMLVVLAIAALVAGLILAYNKVDWFRNFVDAAFAAIKLVIGAVVSWFTDTVVPIFKFAFDLIAGYVKAWIFIYKTAWDLAYTVVEKVYTWFRDTVVPAFKIALTAISDAFTTVIDFIKGLFTGFMDFFTGPDGLVAKFVGIGGALIEGIKKGISNAWGAFTNWIKGLMGDMIKGVLSIFGINSPSKVFMGIGEDIVAGFAQGVSGLADVSASVTAGANSLVTSLPTSSTSSIGYTSAGGYGGGMPTEEQLARALWQLLQRSDLRNGRTVAVA